ncbi:DUF7426 family protein [Demequina flava]|uniref:DUF7426 family protein n=1 Tax=Demequina flava TaxID=1095025 RepID=UPI0007826416|nr:hypothetical protein [Demequina flava]
MSTVDFTDWLTPSLKLPLGGVTYEVAPPDVERAKLILAFVVTAEHRLGLAKGKAPAEVVEVVEKYGDKPLADITLGPKVHAQLRDAGLDPESIRRMAYYGMWYWGRGKERADAIALAMWSQDQSDDQGEGDASGE